MGAHTVQMKAVYLVNDPKVAAILVDPMRRAILDLLRQRPMTQARLANELGLSAPSLSFHMKRLRAKKLVIVVKREIEKHRIMQTFFASAAYLFIYDLESMPKNIARYFYPISLERARSILSASSVFNATEKFSVNYTSIEINKLAEDISRLLVKTAKHYQNKEVEYGEEKVVIDIYKRCINLVNSRKLGST